jgi:hypothetical protein
MQTNAADSFHYRTDFVAQFRRAYETGRLTADGPSTFNGHRVVRYRSISPDSGSHLIIEWYIDPRTARPVGASEAFASGQAFCSRPTPAHTPGPRCTNAVAIATLVSFEVLPASPQNLAHLIARNPPKAAR